jgi:hypothetical protein
MHGRADLRPASVPQRRRTRARRKAGITNLDRVYTRDDLVTRRRDLRRDRRDRRLAPARHQARAGLGHAETILMRSKTGSVRPDRLPHPGQVIAPSSCCPPGLRALLCGTQAARLPRGRGVADRAALDRPHGRRRTAWPRRWRSRRACPLRCAACSRARAWRPGGRGLPRPRPARPAARPADPARHGPAAARLLHAVRPPADRRLRRLRRGRRRLGGAADDLAARDGPWRPRSISPTGSTRATARTCPPWRRWRGHDLIVCVDCGTLSHDPIAAAQGADVVCWTTTWARDPAPRTGRGEPQPAGRGRRASAISAPRASCS